MKRLLTLLLLLVAVTCSAQVGGSVVPGSLSVVSNSHLSSAITAVTVREGLVFEGYGKNYVASDTGLRAKWFDATNPSVYAFQDTEVKKPTLSGNKILFGTGTANIYLDLVLATNLSHSDNSIIMLCDVATYAGSSVAGYGPVPFGLASASLFPCNIYVTASSAYNTYSGTNIGPVYSTAYTGTKFLFSSFGTSAAARTNSSGYTTGNSGTIAFPTNKLVLCEYADTINYPMKGYVYACLVYNRKLTEAQVQQVFSDLSTIYGVAIP